MNVRDADPFRCGGRTILIALAVALAGAVGFVLGWIFTPTAAFASYLVAYVYVATVLIGLAAFVMAAHVMHAGWPVTVRRLAEIGLGAMPVLVVLAIPLVFALGHLYPWMHPERITDAHVRALVEHKRPLMNAGFFCARLAFYVIFWSLIAGGLRRWSLAMDRPGARDLRPRLAVFSAGLLPFLGLTGAFAAFDWIMSLSPDFYSTMYGLYVLAGGFVASVGLLAIMAFVAQRHGYLADVHRSHWYAIGRLLFAFLIFWAYTGFFQYLLIWIANKPIEVKYYIARIRPDENFTSWFIVWGHFALPWLLMLSYAVKRHRGSVTALGAWILFCHYVDIHWLVGPLGAGPSSWRWQDAPALALIGGLVVAVALWRQRGRLVVAIHDPLYAKGAGYESR